MVLRQVEMLFKSSQSLFTNQTAQTNLGKIEGRLQCLFWGFASRCATFLWQGELLLSISYFTNLTNEMAPHRESFILQMVQLSEGSKKHCFSSYFIGLMGPVPWSKVAILGMGKIPPLMTESL